MRDTTSSKGIGRSFFLVKDIEQLPIFFVDKNLPFGLNENILTALSHCVVAVSKCRCEGKLLKTKASFTCYKTELLDLDVK